MDQSMCHELHDSQSMDQLSGTEVEKSNAVNQLTASPNTGAAEVNSKDCGKEKLEMNYLIQAINAPALSNSCATRLVHWLPVSRS